jgi:hypothetical protein
MCPRLRPKACAARAGCSEKSIYTAIVSGALRATRINSRVLLIDEVDLDAWLEQCRTAPPMVGRPNGAVVAQRAAR